MNHIAIFVIALVVGCAIPSIDTSVPANTSPAFEQEIFHAVLEGLYEDGVKNSTVDIVLKKAADGRYAHFVPGCPTCMYVVEAFRHYRARPEFISFKGRSNTWGHGLSDEELAQFSSAKMKSRMKALHGIVARWLDRRMDRLRLDERERTQWTNHLEERAKKGMRMLQIEREKGGMSEWDDLSCPSCDGAVAGGVGR